MFITLLIHLYLYPSKCTLCICYCLKYDVLPTQLISAQNSTTLLPFVILPRTTYTRYILPHSTSTVHTYCQGGVSLDSVIRGSRGPRSRCSHFTWMYLECTRGHACPLSLWWYQLPRFSSASGVLFPWFHGSTLGDCLPFPCMEQGGWAKTHHFLSTPTSSCFPSSNSLVIY